MRCRGAPAATRNLSSGPRRPGEDKTPAVAITMPRRRRASELAEEDDGEERDLHRLRLRVGNGDDERALTHRREHQRGRRDLAERARHSSRRAMPRSATGCRRRQARRSRAQRARRGARRENGCAWRRRCQPAGQAFLRGVAKGLPDGCGEREDDPEPRGRRATSMPLRRAMVRPTKEESCRPSAEGSCIGRECAVPRKHGARWEAPGFRARPRKRAARGGTGGPSPGRECHSRWHPAGQCAPGECGGRK